MATKLRLKSSVVISVQVLKLIVCFYFFNLQKRTAVHVLIMSVTRPKMVSIMSAISILMPISIMGRTRTVRTIKE